MRNENEVVVGEICGDDVLKVVLEDCMTSCRPATFHNLQDNMVLLMKLKGLLEEEDN